MFRGLVSYFTRFRASESDPLEDFLSQCPPTHDFVIAIEGWSKKARYIERYDHFQEAEARRRVIDADPSSDTAFIVRTDEAMLHWFGPERLYELHLRTKAKIAEIDPPPSAA